MIRIKTYLSAAAASEVNSFFYNLFLYKVFTELESEIDWLMLKEGEFKTKHLLTTAV